MLVDCKKCDGTGKFRYMTKTGERKRICNRCTNGKVDIFYVAVKVANHGEKNKI